MISFTSPWLLLALTALPGLYWLLRVRPPAPRRQSFPPTRLLLGLRSDQETPARTPWWLLLLRIVAAALLIVAAAGPLLGMVGLSSERGVLLLVLDNGWAAAGDWGMRLAAADQAAEQAVRAGRPVALLTTARDAQGGVPALIGPATAGEIRARLAALQPMPWPTDRTAVAPLIGMARAGSVTYVADGLREPDDPLVVRAFDRALAAAPALRVIAAPVPPAVLLQAPQLASDGWQIRLTQVPRAAPSTVAVRAEAADGRILARLAVTVAAGQADGQALLSLPADLRNRVDRLTLEAAGQGSGTTINGGRVASAGATLLLDAGDRRRPVGLLAGDPEITHTPLTGAAYVLQRAMGPFAEWREGGIDALLAQPVSMLLAADRPLPAGAPDTARLLAWVQGGGLLVRFAGPDMAQAAQDGMADPLLPVPLLPSDRQMGGAMSWSRPAQLAPFPPASPFAALTAPTDLSVRRQVLADPAADLAEATWARLQDGTPLVTQRVMGAGRVVLFHTTANADWSNLPLTGVFVDMLRRLEALSASPTPDLPAGGHVSGNLGTGPQPDGPELAPVRSLDGFGDWTSPPVSARPIAASAWDVVRVSPAHPPGLYGPEDGRRVLNLSQNLPALQRSEPVPGARMQTLGPAAAPNPLGPALAALAMVLLIIDLLASLGMRGLLRPATAAPYLLLVLLAGPARAQDTGQAAGQDAARAAALHTRLAFVQTGDATLDGVSRRGLIGLSEFVNARTAASLAEPAGIIPGETDLSVYPLLYWPIAADAAVPAGRWIAALNGFMEHGGVLLIDTRDGGTGTGIGESGRDTLRRIGVTAGLAAPPLAPLSSTHVLARSFYLLSSFPGRYAGDTVWVARDVDRSNDSVSPMVVGAHDWAAAWAVDEDGNHPYAVLPDGERQRLLAYRFGVNLVMYALTGNYKGDQVHVPALLQRLGQ